MMTSCSSWTDHRFTLFLFCILLRNFWITKESVSAFQPTVLTSSINRSSSNFRVMTLFLGKDGKVNHSNAESEESVTKEKKRARVMKFLRKVGAVGANQDFSTAMGVDEGPVGKNKSAAVKLEKTVNAYTSCIESGIIDDMSERFPLSSSGTEWSGFTDQVMGGVSKGMLTRETLDGRTANVMKGKVSLYNNGGFIQMATSLSTDPAVSLSVNASDFDGIELDVQHKGTDDIESFNVHLRNPACIRQFSSYRQTFQVRNGQWQTIRLPFDSFEGYGPGSESTPFDTKELRRIGIVAIGKAMEVHLAVSGIRFYKDMD